MGTERVIIHTFDDWTRDVGRKQQQQERRFIPQTAGDLLGPGFGPTATPILDWNQDEASFNGFFWSPIGGINAPSTTQEWCGIAIAEDDGQRGVQIAWAADSGDPINTARRRWSTSGDQTRTYTKWRGMIDTWHVLGATGEPTLQNSWVNTGGSNYSAQFTINGQNEVQLRGLVSGGVISSSLPIFQLPTGYRPLNNVWTVCTSASGNVVSTLVASDGKVYAYSGTYSAYLSLHPIRFIAEQ